jgi:hypothetical protein
MSQQNGTNPAEGELIFPTWQETADEHLLRFAAISAEDRFNWLIQTYELLKANLPVRQDLEPDW